MTAEPKRARAEDLAAPASFDLHINSERRQARSGATFERINPFDGSVAGIFANANADDARLAITAARAAFDAGDWSFGPSRKRYQVLARMAELIAANAQEFAYRMSVESGKPITTAHGEVMGAVKTFQYYAGQALALEGSAVSDRVPDALGLILHEPIGVAGFITPWNFPLLNPVCKIAPALAAGCTVVIKPSHLCPGPASLLAQNFEEAGLPRGVVNVLTSDLERGGVVGQELARSPLVDKIAFTGSTATGRAVMRGASETNKKVALELGGKSANIVFADAPFDAAAATAIGAFCYNSGQQCSAGTRLLVQREIYEEFLAAVVKAAEKQVVGDPLDPTTTMGPLINGDQFARVTSYIDVGHQEGELLTGGAVAPDQDGNFFVRPTIFGNVSNSGRLAQEEIFGPVLAAIPFDAEADAIRIANESLYGLAGGVWTRSIDKALRVVKGVRTGKVFVNCYNSAGIDDMPHGGMKDSGIGREFGREGLAEYQVAKTVQIKIQP
ncbi:aldehyde dehydrogenase family protein [Sinorhizobium fredii]|uniref:aldehyde dehydrogenase family protein n=1 Tax=Rhizobium fredii TaxID=380 RepID=UPI000693E517|nr:aldehyde dehydrogenase family protein [Sinorhizobium fredii]WOS65495.1 aldehyde dehydrogenase family protein [Sinorhizobium fredii GR64]